MILRSIDANRVPAVRNGFSTYFLGLAGSMPRRRKGSDELKMDARRNFDAE